MVPVLLLPQLQDVPALDNRYLNTLKKGIQLKQKLYHEEDCIQILLE